MILLLHTLIEAGVGGLLLFYAGAPALLPGFGNASGPSFDLLVKMYGLAALLLAALSLIGYLRRGETSLYLFVTGTLAAFHFGMSAVQAWWNPDPRVMLLHFLLAIFLLGRYVVRRRSQWDTQEAMTNK